MIQLFTELQEKKNVRSNLSALRASLKEATEEQKAQAIEFVRGHEDLVFGFLQEEDAKTRKNAALLLGDLAVQNALQPLWKAYTREQTLFVKSAYLEAMKALHAEEILSQLKDRLAELEGEPVTEENRKHREAELRALRAILIQYEGIDTHHFEYTEFFRVNRYDFVFNLLLTEVFTESCPVFDKISEQGGVHVVYFCFDQSPVLRFA